MNRKKSSLSICQCCRSDSDLTNVQQSFMYDGQMEVYSEMIVECFSIELKYGRNPDLYICEMCILKLRDSWSFKKQIKSIQLELTKGHISNESQSPIDIKREDTRECNDEIKYHSSDIFSKDRSDSPDREFSNRECLMEEDLMLNDKKSKKKKAQKYRQPFIESCNVNLDTKSKIASSYNPRSDLFLSKSKVKKDKLSYARQRYETSKPYKLNKTALSCHICNETFVTHKSVIMHMSIHYPKFICDICGKSFTFKTTLKRHMLVHNDKIPCKICNRLLKQASMKRHIRVHLKENPKFHICPHCPQRFASFTDRSKHLTRVHDIAENKYRCEVCSKTFLSSASLSEHRRKIHLREINYSCDECGRGFFKKVHLTRHTLVHTGEKKFHCEICGNSYGQKYTLSQHMKIHNNVRNFHCPVCDKKFTQKCTLKSHMKIHKGSGFI